VQITGTWPPLQLAHLGTSAEKAGHEARICDAMNTDRTIRRYPRRDRAVRAEMW
jgi:hypothetical protein